MNVTVTTHEGYTLATLQGEIGEDAKDILGDELHPIIEKPDGRLLVDLSAAHRATSSGLGALVTLVTRANAKGCRVVFCDPSPFLTSIFQATLLTKLFDIEPTAEAGVVRLKG